MVVESLGQIFKLLYYVVCEKTAEWIRSQHGDEDMPRSEHMENVGGSTRMLTTASINLLDRDALLTK